MADVIFIQILRAYLARVPDDGGGFLGALRDPSTAAALGAMHHRAEAPWTVASLAQEVGLSRSVFAARFTQLVGEPPADGVEYPFAAGEVTGPLGDEG